MHKSMRVGAVAAATLATAATAFIATTGSADAATPSAFCNNAANYTIPLGPLGILSLTGSLLSGPAKYNTIIVCYDGKPVQAQIVAVTSLASGYIAIDVPPAAPVTIPIPLPL